MDLISDSLNNAWTSVCDLMLLKAPYSGEFLLALYILHVAHGVYEKVMCGRPPVHFLSYNVRTILAGFGGGIIAPCLCGHTVAPLLRDEIPALSYLACFLFVYCPEAYFARILSTWPAKAIVGAGFQVFRLITIFAMSDMATEAIMNESLPFKATTLDSNVPFFGPIICGTIGGCGGLFLPFSEGLASIDGSMNFAVLSAFFNAFVYHLGSKGFKPLVFFNADVSQYFDPSSVSDDDKNGLKIALFCIAIATELYIQQVKFLEEESAEGSASTLKASTTAGKMPPGEEPEEPEKVAPTPKKAATPKKTPKSKKSSQSKALEEMTYKELCAFARNEGLTGYHKNRKDRKSVV